MSWASLPSKVPKDATRVGPIVKLTRALVAALETMWRWPVLSVLLGSFGLTVISTLIGQNDFTLAELGITVMALVLVVKAAHFNRNSGWTMAISITLIVLGCGASILYLNHKKAASLAIHVDLPTTIAASSHGRSQFVSLVNSEFYPIDALVAVRITNRGSDPIWIGSFDVQYKRGFFSWNVLGRIPGRRVMSIIDSNYVQDVVISGVDLDTFATQNLKPKESVQVFAAFLFPSESFRMEAQQMYLHVCDSEENCSSVKIPLESAGSSRKSTPVAAMEMTLIGPAYLINQLRRK